LKFCFIIWEKRIKFKKLTLNKIKQILSRFINLNYKLKNMSLANKYLGIRNTSNMLESSMQIDQLSTLESIKSRQGWIIAAQVATVASIVHQTKVTTDALKLVNNTLLSIQDNIQNGFKTLESSIESLEINLLENLNEIKWYLFNVDKKLDELIKLVKFSGATKSAEFNKQGFILYKINQNNEAIGQFKKSLQENPLNIEAYINLGFVNLRLDNIKESILNFEMAAKLVQEDFSYYEEITIDRLKTTEVFILDNLATLYSINDENEKSIDVLNKIINKDLDTKTEIVTKFKLSKLYCSINRLDESIGIIKEFINSKYFEPVALAVASEEFSPINTSILYILQNKLDEIKNEFVTLNKVQYNKTENVEFDQNYKKSLLLILETIKIGINENSNYEILLTSEFRERYNDFLQLIDLLVELKNKIETESRNLVIQDEKLKEINQLNSEIDTDYTGEKSIKIISHKILLKKLKLNIDKGINDKAKLSINVQKICSDISLNIEMKINEMLRIDSKKVIDFINVSFDLIKTTKVLLPHLNSEITDNRPYEVKFLLDCQTLIDKYIQKIKFDTNSSNIELIEKTNEEINEDAYSYNDEIDDELDETNYNAIKFVNSEGVTLLKRKSFDNEIDELAMKAGKLFILNKIASRILLQRKLNLLYGEAELILDYLKKVEVIGLEPNSNTLEYDILVSNENQLTEKLNKNS